jgi:HEAT repeat protein
LGGLGAAAATPEFLAALTQLLRDPERDVRTEAAEAVGRLGAAAATPEVLTALPPLLRDPQDDVRKAAARALGSLAGQSIRLFPRRRWFRRPRVISRTVTDLAEESPRAGHP